MEKIEFQLYDWLEGHTEKTVDSDCEEDLPGEFVIHSFGRCIDGKSVYAKIINYTPYFYILLPQKLQSKSKKDLEIIIKKMEVFFKTNKSVKISYKFKATLKEAQLIKMKRAEGFTNGAEFWFVRLVFNSAEGMKKYKYYLENNEINITAIFELLKPVKFKLYEANLPPMFRCFHIRDITGCAWVEVNKYTSITDEDEKESRCDIEIIVDWRNVIPITKDCNAPFKICSFDIECTSIDGEFPQAKRPGDQIIQIGATYNYIGTSTPYRQYIACLNDTAKVNNVIVESCETERDLLLNFLEEINNNDCDIITGYNIFFFDEKYMYDRCKHILQIDIDMSYMSKLKNHSCNFKEMKLSSSALGENLLRFWETPGRIHIDLMKEVQKTFNLSCYKLDFVASKFISGHVVSYKLLDDNQVELICKDVSDLYSDDYIHIEIIKGFISDEIGEKYVVVSVDSINKKIIIKGNNDLIENLDNNKTTGTINWSQAKDDIGPKDIFRLQKGTPQDRAIVAKYCIKDCNLVNLLVNKLEIVTKNIEMANVCCVPLSYLFIRGQGIKLFSLTLKEFRKHKYAFPVIKIDKLYKCLKCTNEYINNWECPKCSSKKREEIESESNSFEGAIVFDPVPQVEYEAVAVNDYASLYPSADIEKNMSHETKVEDPDYDNIPGVKYYDANFKDSDGSIQYRRFAQVNNQLGVIPTILDNLLKTRKVIKKCMNNEKDPFKYKILDAKQLAVKVTANSLYGQLGASTSPICNRDIAACITSTGRERLLLAKKYSEEKLSWIINGLKYFYDNNELDKLEYLHELEIKDCNQKTIDRIKKLICKSDIPNINNLIFQPVIRYGDTDSIFCCYRFRENISMVDKTVSLVLWKKIIIFARTLIEPYIKEKELFNTIFDTYYSDDKITDLFLPDAPICKPIIMSSILLPIEERMKQFIKEYMNENYIPWLWTLTELVEKNQINMFNIKLTQWAEYLLNKYRIYAENLDDNRKSYLLNQILEDINVIFNNTYITPSDKTIYDFSEKFNSDNNNCYPYAREIKMDQRNIYKACKNLLEKTIKEKWVLSGDRKELIKTINTFLLKVTNTPIDNSNVIIYYITEYINKNKTFDIHKLCELLITNLLSDQSMNIDFNEEQLKLHTKDFIENYIKNNGKKTMSEIVEDFLIKEFNIDFMLDKKNHYDKVIDFINVSMRFEDMSDIENNSQYSYYWILPRIDFDMNKKIIRRIDIFSGGKPIIDKRSLNYSMELGQITGELIKTILPFPHDCEYEKTFWPFAILSKKRYVGNKYEFDPNKFKQDFMGIVLKRRDNSPIVKEICGGIINYLINHKSPQSAINYTRKCLQDMFDGKYDIKYFLTSKTLKMKESYKDWRKIGHVYLANKISERDPGNAPQSGDRIEFAIIKVPKPINGDKLLQGDIIETPKFIKEQNLEIDYLFYLTNQIMNPALQFLELVDKNTINLFNEFITKYSQPKVIKEKVIKEKVIKEKVIKEKVNNNKIYINEITQLINNTNDIIATNKLIIEKYKLIIEKYKLDFSTIIF